MSDEPDTRAKRIARMFKRVVKALSPNTPLIASILGVIGERVKSADGANKPLPTAYRIWVREDMPDADAALQFFSSQAASQQLEQEFGLTGKAVAVHQLEPGQVLFEFDPRPVPADLVDTVDDEAARKELLAHGFAVLILRTRFLVQAVQGKTRVAGCNIAVNGTMLPLECKTPSTLQGRSGGHYTIRVQHADGRAGETAIELPLSEEAYPGGVVKVEVQTPSPLAGPVTFLGMPRGMTIVVNGKLVSPFKSLLEFRQGETLDITARHSQFAAWKHQFTLPSDTHPVFVPVGMQPAAGLQGANVYFHASRPGIGGEFVLRLLHAGVTLIRRPFDKEVDSFEGVEPDQLLKALRRAACVSGHLGGMQQIQLPVSHWQDLPRSVWFWVVNLREPGTLVDMVDPSVGTPVALAAYRFAPSDAKLSIVGSGETTEIGVGEPVFRTLRTDERVAVMITGGSTSSEVFALSVKGEMIHVPPARIRGTSLTGQRTLELEPDGRVTVADEDLDRCGLRDALESAGSSGARFYQSSAGVIWLYPSAQTRIKNRLLVPGEGTQLQPGEIVEVGSTRFEIL